MRRSLAMIALVWMLAQIPLAADRLADFEKLSGEYTAVEKAFYERSDIKNPTTADNIRRYESWPGWAFIPRFVALAEAEPNDEATFRCCQWIIERTGSVGNSDRAIFSADQKAWEILTKHHAGRSDLPTLCCKAVLYLGPAQERFLRGLLKRQDLSRESAGFATLALGELLTHKCEYIEDLQMQETASPPDDWAKYVESRRAPDWGKDLVPANAAKFKAESMELFRDVLARYADVPVTITAPRFRGLKFFREKASKSLHALEHLSLGSEAPATVGTDLQAQPLDLKSYRGRVVVVTFWFSGCGACVRMLPQERRLIETYKDRPFALLSVCTDAELGSAQKTAAEHKMTWPCWFDGQNGPIARDWNVLKWPTVIVLDENGRIVGKELSGDQLDAKVAELMKGK
jgi:thiol-disulfide isomerase/thioredoxin